MVPLWNSTALKESGRLITGHFYILASCAVITTAATVGMDPWYGEVRGPCRVDLIDRLFSVYYS